jgi:hypothetical protein
MILSMFLITEIISTVKNVQHQTEDDDSRINGTQSEKEVNV